MANSYQTRNGRTSKTGAFINGIWHCECQPRLPADKLQTKNGGRNHGRWFYTCQKPMHKRCNFFLWSDAAKVREEAAVLSNSRSEPVAEPQTPRKPTYNAGPPTPDTRPRPTASVARPQDSSPSKLKHDEGFDWSSSNDEELLKAEQEMLSHRPLFETPKKAARTETFTSPGKRTFDQLAGQEGSSGESWPWSDDVFATPSTSHRSGATGLPSPTNTPARGPSQLFRPETEPSTLASEVLTLLADSHISSKVERELVDLLNRYDLRTQGVIKGRDISRLAVQSKEKKIADLQARISALEAEKETNRRVIAHLKQDIATSPPRKGNNKRSPPSRRSEG
ncbi:hypothetical protein A1O1_05629 [Capronia coronata CBS 617.96]|uniref:GRF-type domain-containing protein n=1 Tax=Capronia coronata CBS 617.96 TaxID=1182541 RepID=W9Y774_9EURO|nr:uncharacterized protein A1O1_05629 [Capronia coronata CBS 617.96]EXJ88697.1 hypothetical protein A1O1_05629 [Capronia coronata CBS 617.96]